jgi:hypothetical protein
VTRAADYPFPRVRIECPKCGRKGSYDRERFATLVGHETQLPDALRKISADCPKRDGEVYFGGETCGVIYPDLVTFWKA